MTEPLSTRERQATLDLLAVMHGDGGHYTHEHGLEKSARDATDEYYALIKDRDRLLSALNRLQQAADRVIAVVERPRE